MLMLKLKYYMLFIFNRIFLYLLSTSNLVLLFLNLNCNGMITETAFLTFELNRYYQ